MVPNTKNQGKREVSPIRAPDTEETPESKLQDKNDFEAGHYSQENGLPDNRSVPPKRTAHTPSTSSTNNNGRQQFNLKNELNKKCFKNMPVLRSLMQVKEYTGLSSL